MRGEDDGFVMGKTNREKFQGCRRRARAGQGRQAASPDYGLGTLSRLVIESNRLIAGEWGFVSKQCWVGEWIMRLSKSSPSRGEVDSRAQPREDRQAHRQAIQETGTMVPSHVYQTRQTRPQGLPGVASWTVAMPGRPGTIGQCRVQFESSRVKWNRVESEGLKLRVVGPS